MADRKQDLGAPDHTPGSKMGQELDHAVKRLKEELQPL